MKKSLINEITGVPKPIIFWVEELSNIATDLIEEIIRDDEFTEFPMTYLSTEGEQIEEKAYGAGYDVDSKYVHKKIMSKLGHSSIETYIQDPKFKQLPLFDFKLTLDVILVPDEFYEVEFGDSPYDSVDASHGFFMGDKLMAEILGTKVLVNQEFTFKVYLPISVKDRFNKNLIKSYMKPVINHELLHAYEAYNRYLRNEDPFSGRETFLNMISNSMLNVVDPEIRFLIGKFFHLLYLHLYFEVNARTSQLYQEMIERGVSTKEEFLNVLYKSKPWADAKMLAEFKAEDFLKDLSEEKTKEFIEEWDETLQSLNEIMEEQGVYKGKFMEPVPMAAKKNPYLFFKFFENRFHKKGETFKRKAYRLYDIVMNSSVMTENEQKRVQCTACGHTWGIESGDDNPYLCHMCGYDTQEKKYNTKELNNFWANRIVEKWSKKYKKSINCSNPKGFSQKAHCAARRKRKAGGKTKSKSPFN